MATRGNVPMDPINVRRIGIDYHDTFSYDPEFFTAMIWGLVRNEDPVWEVYIITGTPASKRDEIMAGLRQHNLPQRIYDHVLCGFEYDKNQMTPAHFKRMREHKLNLCLEYKIDTYIDDNPYYVSYLKDHGITVMQTIVSTKYLDAYKTKDPFFSCHLQEKQFAFLDDLSDDLIVKK